MEMGLTGIVADGLLFRVSEITPNVQASAQLQDRFVRDLLGALSSVQQTTLVGGPVESTERRNR
jgi:hypothetical protein